MDFSFRFQDPTDPKTTYLYEAIVEQVREANLVRWRGIFAFASAPAIRNVFVEDPDILGFMDRGQVDLLVGLDAITNEKALLSLRELDDANENFQARVFKNSSSGLFHPKISFFEFEDGRVTLIVGSGNFTPGGLRENIEAFSVATGELAEFQHMSEWDDFLNRHKSSISQIDDHALEIGRSNIIVSKGRRKGKRADQLAESADRRGDSAEKLDERQEEAEEARWAGDFVPESVSRILIAQVPAAGGRWHQIHYNKAVVEQFFLVSPNSAQRVFLREVTAAGLLGEEEIRPLVYSPSNKNFKIEVSARRDAEYPTGDDKPLIVLRELGVRNFLYMLLLPGEEGYAELQKLLLSQPSIGKGLHRSIVASADIEAAWPKCPLVERNDEES